MTRNQHSVDVRVDSVFQDSGHAVELVDWIRLGAVLCCAVLCCAVL